MNSERTWGDIESKKDTGLSGLLSSVNNITTFFCPDSPLPEAHFKHDYINKDPFQSILQVWDSKFSFFHRRPAWTPITSEISHPVFAARLPRTVGSYYELQTWCLQDSYGLCFLAMYMSLRVLGMCGQQQFWMCVPVLCFTTSPLCRGMSLYDGLDNPCT